MRTARRLVVSGLLCLCTALDRIPTVERRPWCWYWNGHWGCRLGLSRTSDRLDAHWKTGVWHD